MKERAGMDQPDKQWFCRQIEGMKRSIYRVAYVLLQHPADCEDAASSAILISYEKLYQLKDRKLFAPWFMRILKNECMALLKKRKRTFSADEADMPAYTQAIPDIDLWRAIENMRGEYRVALVLYYLEGYSVEEIACVSGVPAGTVKSWLFRARAELREKLRDKEA
jgi:RNA polymerase sigma-70 factor (ECF subfamily)